MEETSLVCDVASLAWLSHWIPPLVGPPKRFATWFFLAPEHRGTLEVNPSENDGARWIRPDAALAASELGEFPLTIPTWITLDDLQATSSIPLLIDQCITLGATHASGAEQGGSIQTARPSAAAARVSATFRRPMIGVVGA